MKRWQFFALKPELFEKQVLSSELQKSNNKKFSQELCSISGVGPHHGTPAGGNTAGAGGTNDRRAEREIERSREIENWDRVLELAASLRLKRDRKYHVLADFLMGEAKLEGFLKKTAKFHTEKLSAESCPELMEAKASLQKTIGEGGMEVGVELDSYILLGKLHFALGDNAEALKFYGPERGKIESLEEKQLPPRSLKMIAEAFAIKAMALEKESEVKHLLHVDVLKLDGLVAF